MTFSASTAARPCSTSVSFRVAPGEILAVVGPSGGGKSTIADLLLRAVRPASRAWSGSTATTCGALRLADLRRHVALVEQAPFLFHATIAENLRYARPEATDEALRASGRAPRAWRELLARLPEGYATVVGERGRPSPRASGNASPSPAPFSPTPRFSSSTSPRPPSIPRRSGRCWPATRR